MYNLDSLSLKYLISENENFLQGAVVQKIQMPSKREILLSLRNLGENRKLYINVDPKFAHMNFISNKENYSIKIPNVPPMFCMLLRKHMEGAKLQRVEAVEYERIVEFYFEIYDEIGSAVPMCLSVEFMGKHSNAILYNAQNKIIAGCVHNISPEKSSVREVWGGISYIYPPKQSKTDILKTSISGFFTLLDEDSTPENKTGLIDKISSHYYYFSKGFLNFLFSDNSTFCQKEARAEKTLQGEALQYDAQCQYGENPPKKTQCKEALSREAIFTRLQKATAGDEFIKDFWQKNIIKENILSENAGTTGENAAQNQRDESCSLGSRKSQKYNLKSCSLNFLIETYFSHFVLKDALENKKNQLKKPVLKEIKRQNDIILNAGKKTSFEIYRKKGELILANMYNLKEGENSATVEGIEIELDSTKSLSENAQHYFSLYSKGKKAKEILEKRENAAKENLKYLDEILFSIENAAKPFILDEIEEEILEFLATESGKAASGSANGHKTVANGGKYGTQGNKSGRTGKVNKEKPNVESIEFRGFQIFIGKNNKQNDYLIKKISSPEDIWLHGKDCPSSHVFIKTENGKKAVPDEVLLYACNLVKEYSPMKTSAKASIIYTKRKYLKRPPDTHLGYVTYREEKEIVV